MNGPVQSRGVAGRLPERWGNFILCRALPSPMRPLVVLLVPLVLALAGCANQTNNPTPASPTGAQLTTCDAAVSAPSADWKAEKPRVRLTTNKGVIVGDLEMEGAPLTTGNFLNLTRAGFYDGTKFHRVAAGFVIQGGDPNSKNDNPNDDGGGGPGYEIRDEFNPTLRHQKGAFSMAHAGPNTGGSQFFITLTATPTLDDRHAVFGMVAEGMDVVQAIGALYPNNANNDGPPTEEVVVEKVELLDPVAFEAAHAVDVHPVIKEKKAQAGRAARFAVIVQNEGNTRDAIGLQADVPQGWTCSVDAAPVVLPGSGHVVFLSLTPPEGFSDSVDVPLRALSSWSGVAPASGSVKLTAATFGADVKDGDDVIANYAGFLPDGRLFDTSFESVAKDAQMPKFNVSGGYRDRGAWDTFPFTVGGNVIPGFTNLALTAKEGETVTGFIPAEDAYATGNVYQRPLTGKDLVFELEIVDVTG